MSQYVLHVQQLYRIQIHTTVKKSFQHTRNKGKDPQFAEQHLQDTDR
jgi:hypothetical protein